MKPAEPTPANRADDTLGAGIESGMVVVIFAAIGFALDRWLGTAPWLTIGLFVLGAVGVFYRIKAAYALRIDALARERNEGSTAGKPGGPTP